MKYEKLSKQALKCMYVSTAIGCVIILAILGAINWFWLMPYDIQMGQIISLVLAILTLIDMLISPYFRYHRYRYSINEECIDIIEGYLFTTRDIVPIERLHKLQTEKGPIDRMFHVEKVIVTTAGGDVKIRFLEQTRAEEIADSLKKRINAITREERAADGK